ncbi:RNA polymerase II-associated protein 1 [Lamellibrachia satsuma]|nr:RNA polymerase II-associated protein 1 [Lamellibrachia satsuma]
MFSARPSNKDTEDDLLKYQKEFLSANATPAVKVVRAEKRKSDDKVKPLSIPVGEQDKDVVTLGGVPHNFPHQSAAPSFKKTKPTVHFKQSGLKPSDEGSEDPEAFLDKHDIHISKVLSDIVERDLANTRVCYPSITGHGGFPVAMHRESSQLQESVRGGQARNAEKIQKKKSIFAQQFSRKTCSESEDIATDAGVTSDNGATGSCHHAGSTHSRASETRSIDEENRARLSAMSEEQIIDEENRARLSAMSEEQIIDEENRARLSAMSEEQILVEQKNLLQTLDPSLVAFLTRHRGTNGENSTQAKSTGEPMDVSAPALNMRAPVRPTPVTQPSPIPVLDESELPVKRDKTWMHMDDVEAEKMQWMKDLPPPTAGDNKTGQPARFDLHGNLVPANADMPTHLGLHHHGDEPERAGYTLGELFQLARSTFLQQRTLAITTIARIINNARNGSFYDCTSTAIIPALVDGGLVFILRWALDDSTENTMAAAVLCLHSLLVCQQDEEAADMTFSWHGGHEMPSLIVPETETNDNDEEQEHTDAALVKHDIIKGLLKMALLQRLRYIVEVWQPPTPVILHIINILIRIARHSKQAAYELMQCPRLMTTLFNQFLPITWTACGDYSSCSGSGRPISSVLKLIRVVCTAGRNMAATFISEFHLLDCIARYLALQPSEMELPRRDAEQLQTEALHTWQVCLSYGHATHIFSDLYPVLMDRVQQLCQQQVDFLSMTAQQQLAACALIGVLETVTCVAADASRMDAEQRQKCGVEVKPVVVVGVVWSDASGCCRCDVELTVAPSVDWSQVITLIQPIELLLQSHLEHFIAVYTHTQKDVDFLASCVNFVATFYSHVSTQAGHDTVSTLEHIEWLSTSLLLPCLQSQSFRVASRNLRTHSLLLLDPVSGQSELPSNLPELGSLVGGQALVCPLLHEESSVSILLAVSRLLVTVGKLHKDMVDKLYSFLLEDEDLLVYLRKVCQSKTTAAGSSHFAKFENQLQHHLVTMAKAKECVNGKLYHQVSLRLLVRLHEGDETAAHDLLSSVIFNQHFLRDLEVEDTTLTQLEDRLKLHSTPMPSSATQQQFHSTKGDLIEDLRTHWASMRGTYLSCLSDFWRNLDRSRNRSELCRVMDIDSMLTGRVTQWLMPLDWIYLPLMQLHNRTTSCQPGLTVESLPPALVGMATDALRCVYLMECWRPMVLDVITPTTRLCRLMCALLAGNDLFLDPWIHGYLASLLTLYCRKPQILDRIDLKEMIPGISSFYDMFMRLLDQYEGVSFGDSLFGCFVLFPLQQRFDVTLRKVIWAERPLVLRTLFAPVKEVVVPVERLLEPEETDVELLRLYMQALLSGSVQSRWSPVLYLTAVHHVNRFFYTQHGTHTKLRMAMLTQALLCRDKKTRHDLLYYKSLNLENESGMELYQQLPDNRQRIVDKLVPGE